MFIALFPLYCPGAISQSRKSVCQYWGREWDYNCFHFGRGTALMLKTVKALLSSLFNSGCRLWLTANSQICFYELWNRPPGFTALLWKAECTAKWCWRDWDVGGIEVVCVCMCMCFLTCLIIQTPWDIKWIHKTSQCGSELTYCSFNSDS